MENNEKKSKIKIILLGMIVILITLIMCLFVNVIVKNASSNSNNSSEQNLEVLNKNDEKSEGNTEEIVSIEQNPVATMNIKGYGTVKIELYPEIAPESVANFITLAQNGFYDGLKFHRIVEGFIIQGGDPSGDGTGSPKLSDLGIKSEEDREYCIKGEFLLNGHENNLKHEKGVISMARADYTSYSSSLATVSYNSAGSQFFIMTEDSTSLDGAYAPFGKVIDGIEIIEKIEKVGVYKKDEYSEESTPITDVIISTVTIETYGEDYGLPKTLETFDFKAGLNSAFASFNALATPKRIAPA